jgi:hypothetical protein
MRHMRRDSRLANLDGMSVPRVTWRVMANDGLPRRELIKLVHHGDLPELTLTLLVHAELIKHQAGFLEICVGYSLHLSELLMGCQIEDVAESLCFNDL